MRKADYVSDVIHLDSLLPPLLTSVFPYPIGLELATCALVL